MALDPVVPIGNNIPIQPADFRRAAVGSTMTHDTHTNACRAGVVSGFLVSPSGGNVLVSSGCGVVTPSQSTNGSYWVSSSSSNTVTLAAKHPSYDRVDLGGRRIIKKSVDSSGRYQAVPVAIGGTASPAPVAPAVPTGVLPLAEARVRSAGGVIISDIREYTSAAGGVIPVVGTNAPSGFALRPGTPIYVTKQNAFLIWTGSTWRQLAYKDETPRVPQIAAGSVLAGGYGNYTKVVPLPPGRFQAPPIVTVTINSAAGSVGWNTPKVYNVTATEFSVFVDTGSQVSVNWIATDNG